MSRSVKQRIDEAFDDNDVDNAQKFMDIAFESWKQISDSISRTVVFVFLLGAIFELLVDAKATNSVSLGGLSFSNTSLLQIFIPALIAYLIYDAYSMSGTYWDRGDIYEQLVRKFQPKLAASQLTRAIQPQLRGPWGFGHAYISAPRNIEQLDIIVKLIVSRAALFFLPIAFEAQAYYTLVHKYGFRNAYLWISAAVAVFFMIAYITRLILVWTNPRILIVVDPSD